MSETLIVSASGVRGIVGEGLTPEVVARYAAAFGSWLAARDPGGEDGGAGHIVMARDSRVSGGLLSEAAAAGLRAAGWDVADAGVLSTPTALLAVQDEASARGGLVLTASHNPVQWNGLKLAGPEGLFLSVEDGAEVQARFEAGPRYRGWDGLGGRRSLAGVVDHHVERILALPLVDSDAIASARLVVGLDAIRGAAAGVLVRLLERLGCRVEGLNLEPDGRFPRDPEPRRENLGELGERVRRSGADLGMAVDPDGDRLALVDGEGEPVGEDWTLALAAEFVLSRNPGPVVTNLSSSRLIGDAVRRAGGQLHLAPVGEANVARRMQDVGAIIGGEGNGGVMLPDLHLTRDASLAAALILGHVADTGRSLRELVASRPAYTIAKRRAPMPAPGSLPGLYERLEAAAPETARVDRQDGLRLDWPEEDRWIHVRPSGTEPILRVIAEAPGPEEARELAKWALRRLELDGASNETPA